MTRLRRGASSKIEFLIVSSDRQKSLITNSPASFQKQTLTKQKQFLLQVASRDACSASTGTVTTSTSTASLGPTATSSPGPTTSERLQLPVLVAAPSFLQQQQQQQQQPPRRVSFHPDIQVQETLHVNDMTPEERESYWITAEDFERNREVSQLTIQLMDHSYWESQRTQQQQQLGHREDTSTTTTSSSPGTDDTSSTCTSTSCTVSTESTGGSTSSALSFLYTSSPQSSTNQDDMDDDIGYCARGLRNAQELERYTQHHKTVITAVLEEQLFQRKMGLTHDPSYMALIYTSLTLKCRQRARSQARQDARSIREYQYTTEYTTPLPVKKHPVLQQSPPSQITPSPIDENHYQQQQQAEEILKDLERQQLQPPRQRQRRQRQRPVSLPQVSE